MKKRVLSALLAVYLLAPLCPAALAAEGEPVRVAVIDTGISPAAIDAEHIADGRNYIRPQDGNGDKLGHGTAVAGIIVGSEAAGLPGVCPEAVLAPLVWCSKDETGKTVKGKTDMAARAVYDAIDVYGCRVINLSSGAVTDTASLREAVTYAETRGVLVVSSAGNTNETAPETVYYPGAYDTVLCVGAADRDGTAAASFSQRNDTVDLLAPGESLRIASIKGTRIRGSGTSYATAFASGAAAKLLTEDPTLTPAELRALLTSTARDIGPTGYDPDTGWGLLDLDAALAKLREKEPLPFTDVPGEGELHDAVKYAYVNGLITGVTEDRFVPDIGLTRGMVVTILHRLEDEPPAPVSDFTDVRSGAWYAEAVHWAAANGIVDGYGNGCYGPDDGITCEQLAAVLYRYAQYKNFDTTARTDLSVYADASELSEFAMDAMSWACAMGLVRSADSAALTPRVPATRAQVAVLMMRFCERVM